MKFNIKPKLAVIILISIIAIALLVVQTLKNADAQVKIGDIQRQHIGIIRGNGEELKQVLKGENIDQSILYQWTQRYWMSMYYDAKILYSETHSAVAFNSWGLLPINQRLLDLASALEKGEDTEKQQQLIGETKELIDALDYLFVEIIDKELNNEDQRKHSLNYYKNLRPGTKLAQKIEAYFEELQAKGLINKGPEY